MSRGFVKPMLAAVVAAAIAPAAWAQLPPVTPAEEAAGLRVAKATFEPVALRITRGDSAVVRGALLDKDGKAVTGAQVLVYSPGSAVSTPRRPLSDGTFSLAGNTPGSASVMVFVRVPSDSASFQGLGGIKQLARIEVTVADWPVAKIEIGKARYRPYAGTSYKLTATAMTSHGTKHGTAVPIWRSETPAVATVTPGGVVSLVKPGQAILVASAEGVSSREMLTVEPNPTRQLTVGPRHTKTRTGDVVHLSVSALDQRGRPVEGVALAYAVSGLDSAGATVYEDGAFVAENPGAYRVLVSTTGLAAEAVVEATPRPKATPVRKIGQGALTQVTTSDLWVFTGKDGRDYAYTGTHSQGGGERMFVWDVTDPAQVRLVDSVVVDARVVNDVKVNQDASWAIITREGASTRKNGIVVLDLADPAHPKILAELTDSLTGGVHNTWILGDVVYAVNDGTSAMHILDLSDPARPKHAGRWEVRPGETDKTLHDVWSDGKYAYLSYWDDGLVILDVGAGTHGGTPTKPAFVSRIAYGMGNTHTAYRERNYVFVGDEIFGCEECINGPRGYIHVMDVSDINAPKEVARFEVPEAGTHNIWVEDGLLYIAYYQGGLRIVDVSGELRGDLYRQGRQVGWIQTTGEEGKAIVPNSAMAWGPQPFKGNIFVSDMHSGLWVVKHDRPQPASP